VPIPLGQLISISVSLVHQHFVKLPRKDRKKYCKINFILSLLFNLNKISYEKLEQLSMLSIDKKIQKDLTEVIGVVERMCEAATIDSESLIQFEYLG